MTIFAVFTNPVVLWRKFFNRFSYYYIRSGHFPNFCFINQSRFFYIDSNGIQPGGIRSKLLCTFYVHLATCKMGRKTRRNDSYIHSGKKGNLFSPHTTNKMKLFELSLLQLEESWTFVQKQAPNFPADNNDWVANWLLCSHTWHGFLLEWW